MVLCEKSFINCPGFQFASPLSCPSSGWYTRFAMQRILNFFRIHPIRLTFAAIALALLGLFLLYYGVAKSILITIDDHTQTIRTHQSVLAKALERAGIPVSAEDLVSPALDTPVARGMSVAIQRAQAVWLDLDGEQQQILTASKTAANILADAGVALFPGDQVWIDGIPIREYDQAGVTMPRRVRYRSAISFRLEYDGSEQIIYSAETTLAAALQNAGIVIFEGDALDPALETIVRQGLQASLVRSIPLVISIDALDIISRSAAETVGEALIDADIALSGLDYSIPGEEESLPEDGLIRVIRVIEQVRIDQQPLPFDVIYEAAPNLAIDTQEFLSQGAYGVSASRVRIRYEDSIEVNRQVEAEWVARAAEPRVVGYGTQIVAQTVETADGTITYWRVIPMWATSYTASSAGTPVESPDYGITACGRELTKGLVAIDRRYIPFYTPMYVPGYGFAEACDTGGGVKGRWIDLGFDEDNYVSWAKNVPVYFLWPPPAPEAITWIFP
jgi:resuscitation-promoting factor RpfB